MSYPKVKCPAGEVANPLLSRNKHDVMCRVHGTLRPAQGAICCDRYWECGIWKAHKQIEMDKRRSLKDRAQTVSEQRPHVQDF